MASLFETNYRTLKNILEYNDVKLKEQEARESNSSSPAETSPTPKRYTFKVTTLLSVLDWNAIYSNDKLFTSILFMIILILSQLVFSYIAFALVSVEQNISMFYISQALNLICSYIMPMALIRDLDDVFENPFAELSKEVEVFRQLRNCVVAQSVCTIISIIAVVKVFTTESIIEQRFNIALGRDAPVDMTFFVRTLQLISFQLTLINLILASVNLFMTSRKIRHCFNRVERYQHAGDRDLIYNAELMEQRFVHDFF